MLKILQARLQQYVNNELPDVQAGFRKGRGTRDQIANIHWIIKKVREFQKNIYIIDYFKAFDCVDHNKLWKILQEMRIPASWEICMQVRKQQLRVNNLRYADDTTLMAESEKELKSLLMKMKEESEKVGLKFNI